MSPKKTEIPTLSLDLSAAYCAHQMVAVDELFSHQTFFLTMQILFQRTFLISEHLMERLSVGYVSSLENIA